MPPYPSHLAITGQETVEPAEVPHNLLQGFSNHQPRQRFHCAHHYRENTY